MAADELKTDACIIVAPLSSPETAAATIMVFIEGTRFLKDLFNVLDATQLAAIRLILIGLGLILFLIYRPQGFLPEYRLKTRSLVRERPSVSQSAS